MLQALVDALRGLLALFGLVQEKRTLIIVGLDNAGKTTLLHKLRYGQLRSFVPTQRPSCEELAIGNVTLQAWDLGGHQAVRELWKSYELAADAIAFVVDSADAERLGEAADELAQTARLTAASAVPIAVLANKRDRRGVRPLPEIESRLRLAQLNGEPEEDVAAAAAGPGQPGGAASGAAGHPAPTGEDSDSAGDGSPGGGGAAFDGTAADEDTQPGRTMEQQQHRRVRLFPCSLVSGTGYIEALEWLVTAEH